MKKFINLNKQERKNIIQKTSADLGFRFDIVEKDIWVCYVLEKLFLNDKLKDNLIFKGGTCLSKAYNAIARFSEDVDITINAEILDIKASSQTLSGNQKYTKRNKKATRKFVEIEILPYLNKVFDDEIGKDNYKLVFDESDKDNVTLFFNFPHPSQERKEHSSGITRSLTSNLTSNLTRSLIGSSEMVINKGNYNYIKPKIKLEFGSLGGVLPMTKKTIKPYAQKILPDYFSEFEVNTLDIKRNFIEKLLIMHSICFRPQEKLINTNYSRHYYDVFSIIKSGLKIEASKDLEILELVVKNKKDFWNESWIEYDEIKIFSDIKLIPNESRILEIKKDYKNMGEMFFGYSPGFNDMILILQEFEDSLINT